MSSSREILEPDVFSSSSEVSTSMVAIPETLPSRLDDSVVTFREDPLRPGLTRQIADYLEIVFKYRMLILRTFLCCLVLGWLALLLWPRSYESETKLLVRVGRESVSLDPTATTSQTLMLQKTQEEEINSALEVLSSRQVAETVVENLGAGNVLDGFLPAEGDEPDSGLKAAVSSAKQLVANGLYYTLYYAGLKDDISDHELAVRRVQETVYIYAPKQSAVITVHAESKSPEMAQAIASQVTQSFLDQHLQVSMTRGSMDFFENQSSAVESKLKQLVRERSEYMKQRKIVSVDANRTLLKDQLTAIDRDIMLARGEFEQAQAECEDILQKLDQTDDEIVASKLESSDETWSGMRQRVYELELLEGKLASMYKDDHQLLVQTREQLETARKILVEMQSERVDESTTPNPAKRRMQEDLQKQQTRLAGLRSVLEEKERQRQETQAAANELLTYEQELSELDREIGLVETSLQTLRGKLEEARVIDELQSERISNISVFQPATLVERAVSPKKKIFAVAFAMLGLGAGFALAFLRHAASPSLRNGIDVQNQLGYPVLAEIPQVPKTAVTPAANQRNQAFADSARAIVSEVLLCRSQSGSLDGGFSLGVIGVEPGVGATSIAIQLAEISSRVGALKTVLVDADAKDRGLSRAFQLNGTPGLVELVDGDVSHSECVQRIGRAKYDVIASSSCNSDSRITAVGREIAAALHYYRQDSDLMIVDLPPADQPDQAVGLAHYLDGVIVVVEAEKTRSDATERLLSRLATARANVIGVAINKQRSYLPRWIRKCVQPTG